MERVRAMEATGREVDGAGRGRLPLAQKEWQTDAEYAERRAIQVSQLFVATTRARDRLFVLCKDRPGAVLSEALAHFEERDERP